MNAPQRSEAWALARCGRATASEFAKVLAKGKEGRMRAAYARRILAERLTGKPMESFKGNHDTDRGIAQEPLARTAYEVETGTVVMVPEFIPHPDIMAGCSPDGLIGDDGGGEFKCVIPTVQIEIVERGGCPPEHIPQVQGNLWITRRRWWDFCSYSPEMRADHLKLYIFRVERNEEYIEWLERNVRTFLAEIDQRYERLMETRSMLELLTESVARNQPLGAQA